jgi:hypothetical protein
MYKIANRTQFQLISYGPYEWLKRNKPNLLDKHFPIIDTAAENKKKLLGLESKPKCSQQNPGERKLWLAFIRYIDPKNGCYDPSFDQLIRKKQPAWFIDTTAENKKKILKAKDRPSSTAKDPEERRLGIALIGYTNKNKSAYDPTFNNLIRKTKPEWFIDTKIRNKEILLKLKHRPSSGPSRDLTERGLAQKLLDYTTKTRGCYDPEFDELIRKTKPEWFINTTTEKKNRLLKLSDRPSSASEDRNEKLLAAALRNYIDKNSGSYDPAFDKLIRKKKGAAKIRE